MPPFLVFHIQQSRPFAEVKNSTSLTQYFSFFFLSIKENRHELFTVYKFLIPDVHLKGQTNFSPCLL